MKTKVSDLSSAKINYWVAKAEGLTPSFTNGPEPFCMVDTPAPGGRFAGDIYK